jgi:hydrogenase maturation factor HypE
MQKLVKRAIDRQISGLSAAGYPTAAILLSRDKYTELLRELAYDLATDDIDPIGVYEDILVVVCPGENVISVVPSAEVHWNNASEIDEITTPVERKSAVRFTEL